MISLKNLADYLRKAELKEGRTIILKVGFNRNQTIESSHCLDDDIVMSIGQSVKKHKSRFEVFSKMECGLLYRGDTSRLYHDISYDFRCPYISGWLRKTEKFNGCDIVADFMYSSDQIEDVVGILMGLVQYGNYPDIIDFVSVDARLADQTPFRPESGSRLRVIDHFAQYDPGLIRIKRALLSGILSQTE